MFPDITCDDIFTLETSRLWLRWLRASDTVALAAFASLASVAQMTASIPHPYPKGEADRFILHARGSTAAGRALILAATLKTKTRPMVGLASAQVIDSRTVEIGYAFDPAYQRRGFATEATSALVDAVFNLTDARVISATSRTINPASRRVLQKCGFASVGEGLKDLPARGGKFPCEFFVRDRRDWSTPHRGALPKMAEQQTKT